MKLAKIKTSATTFSKVHLAYVILVFACIGGLTLLRSQATGPNVWVATTGSDTTCVRGDQTKPCASFQKACQVAVAGDVIQVNNGTYAAQTVTCAKTSPGVTFQAQTQYGVLVSGANDSGGLAIGSRSANSAWLTFDGIDAYELGVIGPCQTSCVGGEWPLGDPHRTNHITVNHMKVTAKGDTGSDAPAYVDQTDYFTWQNSEVGPVCCNADGADVYPTLSHVTIDNVYIHDIAETCADIPAYEWSDCGSTSTPFSNNHIDCLQFVGGDTITISNSKLINCAAGTMMNGVNRQKYNNLTLENNFFQGHVLDLSGGGGAGGSFGYAYTGFVHLYFNDVPDGTDFQDWQPGGDYQMVGNIFGDIPPDHGDCNIEGTNGDSNASFTVVKYNIFDGDQPGSASACGDPTNFNANASYVNSSNRPAGIDLHLNAGSPGINSIPANFCSANPAYCPVADIDGQTRPAGGGYDIGADEVLPSPSVWVSTTGNDTTCARGDQTKPCASFQKACAIATAGDIIQVAGGTYSSQSITCAKTSPGISFVPAVGATVSVSGGMNVTDAAWLTFTGNNPARGACPGGCNLNIVGTLNVSGNSHDINFTGVHFDNRGDTDHAVYHGSTTTGDPTNITYTNDYIDGTTDNAAFYTDTLVAGHAPANITVQDSLFDNLDNTTASFHMECLYINGVTGLKIYRNNFKGCASTGAINLTHSGPNAIVPTGVDIENNFFNFIKGPDDNPAATGSYDINFDSSLPDTIDLSTWKIEYNTFHDDINTNGQGNGLLTYIGNLGNLGCGAFQQAANPKWNISTVSSCGGTATQQRLLATAMNSSNFVNFSNDDFHLVTGAAVIDMGGTAAGEFPANDIDNVARYSGAAADPGADEYTAGSVSGPSTGDLNSDGHVNITDLSILLSHYGQSGQNLSTGDCNSDGTVNITDLSILLSYYGT